MKKRSPEKWFSFNFEEADVCISSEKAMKKLNTRTRSKDDFQTEKLPKRSFNFEDAIAPKCKADLAVHPKKLKELEDWIRSNVENKHQKLKGSFLLLTGPSGCGKTAALKVLCKELGISISEWINPVEQDFEFSFKSNHIDRFKEFLTDSKWNSLFDCGSDKKIVLVEDFPNVISYKPEEFFNILEECSVQTRLTFVFICTDSVMKNGFQLSQLLFPQEIKTKYCIHNISFNAVADTIMKNALKGAQKIVEENADLLRLPSSNVLSAIVCSAMGDIRSAMKQYYLASLVDSKDLPVESVTVETGKKRKRSGAQTISKVTFMNRDETLGLFHGLGRVLNPKRKPVGDSWRLHCDVERLIDEFSIHPATFTAFLFENYIKYFGDLNELSAASDMLSLSQRFVENWGERHDTVLFGLWISVLGIMVANEHRLSQWMPIRGPRKILPLSNLDARVQKLSPTDHYYYNIINKSSVYHKFAIKK